MKATLVIVRNAGEGGRVEGKKGRREGVRGDAGWKG